VDARNVRTWRQALVGVWVTRSLRLLAVGRVLAPQRRAQSVKAAAQGLAYFLAKAQFPHAAVSPAVLEAAVGQLDPAQVVRYRGKALVAVDPTEYGKRSRRQGKKGRGMAHIGRVRCTTTKKKTKKTAQTRAAARQTCAGRFGHPSRLQTVA
jgi:hypothetical protein